MPLPPKRRPCISNLPAEDPLALCEVDRDKASLALSRRSTGGVAVTSPHYKVNVSPARRRKLQLAFTFGNRLATAVAFRKSWESVGAVRKSRQIRKSSSWHPDEGWCDLGNLRDREVPGPCQKSDRATRPATVATKAERPSQIELSPAMLPTLSRLTADAKPFWCALYHSLTLVDAEDYESRRSSIYEILWRCIRLRIRGKLLQGSDLVARDGVEPPTCFLPVVPYVADSDEKMAGATGLEPAASCVTGRRSNQQNYAPA